MGNLGACERAQTKSRRAGNFVWMKACRELEEEEAIYQTLPTLKSGILKSLDSSVYLSPLHKKLATKARSFKSLASLYGYHPLNNLSCSSKEKLTIIKHLGIVNIAITTPAKI